MAALWPDASIDSSTDVMMFSSMSPATRRCVSSPCGVCSSPDSFFTSTFKAEFESVETNLKYIILS